MAKNTQQTELIWSGKFTEEVELPTKRLVDKITLPFQTIEVINEPREQSSESLSLFGNQKIEGWRNKLIWGDNKLVISSLLKDYAGKINLIYIDPPFDVGADFSVKVKVGDEEITKEPSILEEKAYRDTWGRGTDSFLHMIYERILLMKDLLAENGSIYVHCDYRVNSYIEYLSHKGNMRYYFPDFVVKTKDGMFIVETKGREDLEVAQKDARANKWCEDASKISGIKWHYLKVPQEDFYKYQYAAFNELVSALS